MVEQTIEKKAQGNYSYRGYVKSLACSPCCPRILFQNSLTTCTVLLCSLCPFCKEGILSCEKITKGHSVFLSVKQKEKNGYLKVEFAADWI